MQPKLALATALLKLGNEVKALQLAEEALRLDSRYGTVEFQRENLWGDRLVARYAKPIGQAPLAGTADSAPTGSICSPSTLG